MFFLADTKLIETMEPVHTSHHFDISDCDKITKVNMQAYKHLRLDEHFTNIPLWKLFASVRASYSAMQIPSSISCNAITPTVTLAKASD